MKVELGGVSQYNISGLNSSEKTEKAQTSDTSSVNTPGELGPAATVKLSHRSRLQAELERIFATAAYKASQASEKREDYLEEIYAKEDDVQDPFLDAITARARRSGPGGFLGLADDYINSIANKTPNTNDILDSSMRSGYNTPVSYRDKPESAEEIAHFITTHEPVSRSTDIDIENAKYHVSSSSRFPELVRELEPVDDAFFEKYYPDEIERAKAKAFYESISSLEFRESFNAQVEVTKGAMLKSFIPNQMLVGKTLCNYDGYLAMTQYGNEGLSINESHNIPGRSEFLLRFETGMTTLGGQETKPILNVTPKDVPAEGFIKAGVERYKDMYDQIYEIGEKEGLSNNAIREAINNLDSDFENYLTFAFYKEGLSFDEARQANSQFGYNFRMYRNGGATLDDSYSKALEALKSENPNYKFE